MHNTIVPTSHTDFVASILEHLGIVRTMASRHTMRPYQAQKSLYLEEGGNISIALIFCFVYLNSFRSDLMTKYYPFSYHEVAFLPIKDKASIFTSFENFVKIVETMVK
jgi:hypothetical protein